MKRWAAPLDSQLAPLCDRRSPAFASERDAPSLGSGPRAITSRRGEAAGQLCIARVLRVEGGE
jgi:hypothetical protein